MSLDFINRYYNNKPNSFTDVAVATDGKMLVVGQQSLQDTPKGTISLFDSQGNFLHGNYYPTVSIFKTVLALQGDEAGFMVSGENENGAFVARIDGQGGFEWAKKTDTAYIGSHIGMVRMPSQNTFAIVNEYQESNNEYFAEIYKVDADGGVLQRTLLSGEYCQVSGISEIPGYGLAIYGRANYSDNPGGPSGGVPRPIVKGGFIVRVDELLEADSNAFLISEANMYISSACYPDSNEEDDSIFLMGEGLSGNERFLGKLRFGVIGEPILTAEKFFISSNAPAKVGMTVGNDSIYITYGNNIARRNKSFGHISHDALKISISKVHAKNGQLVFAGTTEVDKEGRSTQTSGVLNNTYKDTKLCNGRVMLPVPHGDANYDTNTIQITSTAQPQPAQISINLQTAPLSFLAQELCEFDTTIKIPYIQSEHIKLQVAGSTGDDSTVGIHLRWTLAGALGGLHLPKGNYSSNNHNFNRPADDFVRIFKASYSPQSVTVNFRIPPRTVDNSLRRWIYYFSGRVFYLKFNNAERYDQILSTTNPNSDSYSFISSYGNNILEVQCPMEEFFQFSLHVSNKNANPIVRAEGIVKYDDGNSVEPRIACRNSFEMNSQDSIQMTAENLSCVRFSAQNCIVQSVQIHLYSEVVETSNWQAIGEFAVSTDSEIFNERFEPTLGAVDETWKRFHGSAVVSKKNYEDKWFGKEDDDEDDRSIEHILTKYLELSESADNPKANETIPFTAEGPTDSLNISNLDVLEMLALDYHVARVLGLGYLDVASDTVGGEKFIYKMEYTTTADLGDGKGENTVNHRYISLPTTINDSRLPVELSLKEPIFGIPSDNSQSGLADFLDEEGYTLDGKSRFISLRAEEEPEYEELRFFEGMPSYNISEHTTSVYLGIAYKNREDEVWVEISYDQDEEETLPLQVPENEDEVLFVHQEKTSGVHEYALYTINWFSRSQLDQTPIEVDTTICPRPAMSPPTDLAPLLIEKESPLMLTSQNEQDFILQPLLDDGATTDKTLIRLKFEYGPSIDVVNYSDPDNGFPDEDEVFATHAEVFFKKNPPYNTQGMVQCGGTGHGRRFGSGKNRQICTDQCRK